MTTRPSSSPGAPSGQHRRSGVVASSSQLQGLYDFGVYRPKSPGFLAQSGALGFGVSGFGDCSSLGVRAFLSHRPEARVGSKSLPMLSDAHGFSQRLDMVS